jgi:hypothetical protein
MFAVRIITNYKITNDIEFRDKSVLMLFLEAFFINWRSFSTEN